MAQSSAVNSIIENNRKRKAWLDIVRITACIMVIVMHAPIANVYESTNTLMAIVSYLMSPCNGLFFMVSGSLLIKANVVPFESFMKKRLKRICPPLLSWSMIYILLWYGIERTSLQDIIKAVIMMPLSAQGCGYFWFMYVLIGCYLMIPIWSAWLQNASRKSLRYVLMLWFVTSFIPLLHSFSYIEEFNSWMYYLGGFMGYFLLGYYIYTYADVATWKNIVIGGLMTVVLMCLHLYVEPEINLKGRLYCYLQPYVITACFTLFCTIYQLCRHISANLMIARLSDASFGIYLSQSLILNYCLKEIEMITQLGPVVGFFVRVILTFVLGYLLVRIISYTPLKRILTV